MAYCRFENTLQALEDCYEHFEDEDLSNMEATARFELLELCKRIVEEFEYSVRNPRF